MKNYGITLIGGNYATTGRQNNFYKSVTNTAILNCFTLSGNRAKIVMMINAFFYFLFFYLVPAFLRDYSLCWDHWEVVQTPHTNQALP